MPKNEELNEVLKRIKSVYHLNQKEVAERIGVHYHYLSNVLNGHYPYNDELKRKIARAYPDVDLYYIVTGQPMRPICGDQATAALIQELLAVEQQRRILLRKVAETLR